MNQQNNSIIETTKIVLFKGKQIRKIIHNNEWWFSVVDVAQALTDQEDDYTARKYWNKLAQRLREEGSELVTFCHQLKLEFADGKKYERRDFPHYPIDPVAKSRAVQTLAGKSRL